MEEPQSETAMDVAVAAVMVGFITLGVSFIVSIAIAFQVFGWWGVPLPFIVTAVGLFLTALVIEYRA